MSMRCRHKARIHHLWGEYEQQWGEAPHIPQSMSEATSCADCGSWLPLGPANDEPEAVKVEIEAAHIAVSWPAEKIAEVARIPCKQWRTHGECSECEPWLLADCIAKHEEG